MAIDPYSRHLFWSDNQNNFINVTTLNKVAVGVIVQGPGVIPRALAINPLNG